MSFDSSVEGFDADPLERFCLNKKVLSYHPQFFEKGMGVYWTVLVQYETNLKPETKRKSKRDVLSNLGKDERVLFDKLRSWGKDRADVAGYPPYLIATDEQLVTIIREKVMNLDGFASVPGYGKQKRAKYGNEIVELVSGFFETPISFSEI